MNTIFLIACIVTKAGTYQSCERPVAHPTVSACYEAMKIREQELAEAGFFPLLFCKGVQQ